MGGPHGRDGGQNPWVSRSKGPWRVHMYNAASGAKRCIVLHRVVEASHFLHILSPTLQNALSLCLTCRRIN
jgi:hypothetical protein